jgi:predicted small secreted protein
MYPILIQTFTCGYGKMSQFRVSLLMATACLLIVGGVLSSCQTMQGFGRDVEKTGEAIEDAAR